MPPPPLFFFFPCLSFEKVCHFSMELTGLLYSNTVLYIVMDRSAL